MKPESLGAYHFTFLHGARVRSGSNYLGSIMGCNPHIQLVPPGMTMFEFPLIDDMDAWEGAFAAFLNKYKGKKEGFDFRRFSPHLGDAWLTYLIEMFSLQPGHTFIKWSSVRNIEKFFDVFPESKLILLVRDGRENAASSVKATLATRHHKGLVQKLKTKLSHLLKRDFRAAAEDWSSAVRKIMRVDEELRKSRRHPVSAASLRGRVPAAPRDGRADLRVHGRALRRRDPRRGRKCRRRRLLFLQRARAGGREQAKLARDAEDGSLSAAGAVEEVERV